MTRIRHDRSETRRERPAAVGFGKEGRPSLDTFVGEVRRIHTRYQVEVVEAFALCPWAERARREGRVFFDVDVDPELNVERVVERIVDCATRRMLEVGFLVFPRASATPLAFCQWVDRVRNVIRDRGHSTLTMAAFHPKADADLSSGARLVPFLRRSPDPTIQLVRRSVLDHVRRGGVEGKSFIRPSVFSEGPSDAAVSTPINMRIAEANLETVRRVGHSALERVFADIMEDRNRTYDAFGVG